MTALQEEDLPQFLSAPLAQQKPVAMASLPPRLPALLPTHPQSSVLRGSASELDGTLDQLTRTSRSLSVAVVMKSELSTQLLGLYHIQGIYHNTEEPELLVP